MAMRDCGIRAGAPALSRRRLLQAVAATAILAPLPAGSPVSAQTPVAALPNTLSADASPRFRAVAQRLMAAMAASGVPGAALGILADGVEEHAAFGVTGIDTTTAVTPDTLFQIGSLTKTVTATAIMGLVEAGTLDLAAPVRTYLPDFTLADPDVAARVTVRQLLTHMGGWWGDLFVDTGNEDDAIAAYIRRWFPTLPQLSPLGKFVSYNNAGFILLGHLIEVMLGQPYRVAARQHVLAPLSLDSSFFAPVDVSQRPHALGHITMEGDTRIQEPLFLPRSVDPAGGLWSTAPQLLRYARFHLGSGGGPGGDLLSPETLALMRRPQAPIPGQPALAIGLPWFIVDLPGERLLMHGGTTFGQQTEFWLAPRHGFACVVLANALPGGAIAAQLALAEAFAQYLGPIAAALGAATPAATPTASPAPAATPSPAMLDQYAGRYEAPDATYEFRVEDGGLVLHYALHPLPEQVRARLVPDIPPRVPVQFIAEDQALVTIAGLPLTLAFVRRDDGSVGWAAASLRLVPKVADA